MKFPLNAFLPRLPHCLAALFLAHAAVRCAGASPESFVPPSQVQLQGVLGEALVANHNGRLSHFVQDESSGPIKLFSPESVRQNLEGDWYGEHAGKWLYAAARAANRTGDSKLAANVRRVADYLVGVQEPDGYLGTYAPGRRFMHKEALGKRTWDIWVHSYLIIGLLEVNKYFPDRKYVEAARRIGDLCWRTLTEDKINITDLGNHLGISATVLLDPAVELYTITGDKKYLDLAQLILTQANERPGLLLLPQALANGDVATIGDGKAYQLCWNFVGLAKLYRATGDARYLRAVKQAWENIRQYHLTLGGGPWGGAALASREIFNSQTVFSPEGYVETCSTFSWIQLNRELLSLTGEAKYAEEIEKSAYNDLLGAQDPNGEDWCYYSFPNGKRINTTYWRCCKSSGAMALEELSSIAYGITSDDSLAINLFGPSRANLRLREAGLVKIKQDTDYPFDGNIRIQLSLEQRARFTVLVRVPAWADRSVIAVNGRKIPDVITPGSYAKVTREWQSGDEIDVQFPMRPMLHEQVNRSVQEAKIPDGTTVSQEVLHSNYVAITRGPLVYATTLIDGFKTEESIRIANSDVAKLLEDVPAKEGTRDCSIRLNLSYRAPLVFTPYFETGGRKDGVWRITWMHVSPN